jgi:pyrimidine operon attenuation protein/uracil phosphoribosyltransferase
MLVLDHQHIQRKILRLAHALSAEFPNESGLMLVGIEQRGLELAQRLSEHLNTMHFAHSVHPIRVPHAALTPEEVQWHGPLDLAGKQIVVVDDVMHSGRTMLLAVSRLLSGNPSGIRTLALVDRQHRRYPVSCDFQGLTLATTLHNTVEVRFSPNNDEARLV